MDPTSPTRSSNGERPPKRRRVAVACRPCRERKSKCDGISPTCGLCIQLGSPCSYPPALSKSDLLREEFETFKDRMTSLEKILASVHSRFHPDLETPDTPASRASESTTAAAIVATTAPATAPASSAPPSGDDHITLSDNAFVTHQVNQADADGIGTVPLSSRDDCAFFGPSSNISLLRLVSRALATATGTSQNPRGIRSTPDVVNRPENGVNARAKPSDVRSDYPGARGGGGKGSAGGLTLPSDRQTRELFAAFFQSCNHVHPHIHEPRFLETYEEVRRSGYRVMRRSWLALVYMVFAMAAFTWPYRSTGMAHLNPESEAWYKMAAELTLTQVFSEDGMNVEVVQTLMAMVMYLQSTQNSAKTWLFHGLAVRVAYQLGLHSAEASRTADPIEREVRKRTWYQLVTADRILSMTFGRPPEIQDTQTSLGPPQPFEDFARRGYLIKEELALLLLQSSLGLSDITNKAVDILYGKNCGLRPAFSMDSVAKVYTLESELLQWTKGLPPMLKLLQDQEVSGPVSTSSDPLETPRLRLRTVITLRYLNARLLVHRPVLEGLLEAIVRGEHESDHWRMMRKAGANSVNVAVSSAITTLTIIHRRVSSASLGQQLLGAWWFSLYYTFNAALVLLGSSLVSRLAQEQTGISIHSEHGSAIQASYQSLEILDGLDEGHSTVSYCRTYLQELIRVFETISDRTQTLAVEATANPMHTSIASSQYPSRDPVQMGDYASSASVTPFAHPQFRQFTSDLDLENFLFPLGMQMASGHISGPDAAYVL